MILIFKIQILLINKYNRNIKNFLKCKKKEIELYQIQSNLVIKKTKLKPVIKARFKQTIHLK